MIMQFTVNTKTKTIKPKGFEAFPAPQGILDYFLGLDFDESSTSLSTAIPNSIIERDSKLYFVQVQTKTVPDPDDPEKTINLDSVHEIFYFDLKDYQPKTLTGKVIKDLNRIKGHMHDLSDLTSKYGSRLDSLDHTTPWWYRFYMHWKCLAKGEQDTRTKLSWLFKLPDYKLERLQRIELLLKAGFCSSSVYEIAGYTDYAWNKSKPAEIFGLSQRLWKALAKYSQSENLRSYDMRSFCTTVKVLDSTINLDPFLDAAEKLDATRDLIQALVCNRSVVGRLQTLVSLHGYDPTRVATYLLADIRKQGLRFSEALEFLEDYSDLAYAVDGDLAEKYPKYLRSMHDIYVVKAKDLELALEDLKFMRAYENRDLSFYMCSITVPDSLNTYRINVPNSAKDVIEEGQEMHHCVATYVEKVAKDPSRAIVFLRSGSSSYPTRHLTIEIYGDQIVQARGKFNRDPEKEEFKALIEYAQYQDFTFSEDLQAKMDALEELKDLIPA